MLNPFDADTPYGRTVLLAGPADDSEEILAMTWRPGATCAPHDHGGAAGVVHLIRGRLTETRFAFSGGALVETGRSTFEAPATFAIAAGVIHAMTAHDAALTIHRYAPRVSGMRVHDPEGRRTLVVRDDCGAWIPADPALILAIEPWAEARR